MIKEVGINGKCLDLAQIEDGTMDVRIMKIVKVVQKISMENVPYLRMTIKDINGNLIVGRMFSKTTEFLSEWNSLSNSIVSARFTVNSYMGRLSLTLEDIKKPEQNIMALLNEDAFDSTYELLGESLNNLNSLKCKNENLQRFYDELLDSTDFTKLFYSFDEDVFLGKNGGEVGILSLVADSLVSYKTHRLITDDDVIIIMCSLILNLSSNVSEYPREEKVLRSQHNMYRYISSGKLDDSIRKKLLNCALTLNNAMMLQQKDLTPLSTLAMNLYKEKRDSQNILNLMSKTTNHNDCLTINNLNYYKD